MRATCRAIGTIVAGLALCVSQSHALEREVEIIDFTSNLTCGMSVQAVEAKSAHEFDLIVRGFLTGTNLLRGRVTPTEFAGYQVWLKTYCTQNPFHSFTMALARLDYSLGEGQTKIGNSRQKNDGKK